MNGDHSKPVILVADDDEDFRYLIRHMLGDTDYRVVEATNGREAVSAAVDEQPDLILMDLQMPMLNGIAATRLIRQRAECRKVPIIILSVYDPEQHAKVALAAGGTLFFQKPLEIDHLKAVIDRFLRRGPIPT
jgi:CheY-like chemotaxis protein